MSLTEQPESFIEEEWEFKAPKYFDFDKIINATIEAGSSANLDISHSDQWFFTSDAQHLEHLDPKYVESCTTNSSVGGSFDIAANISTVSKFSVHNEDKLSISSSTASHISSASHTQYQNHHETSQQRKKTRPVPKLTIPVTPKLHTQMRIRQKHTEQSIAPAPSLDTMRRRNSALRQKKFGKMDLTVVKSNRPSDIKTVEKVQDKETNITKFKPVVKSKPLTPKPFKFLTDSRIHDSDRSTMILPGGRSPFEKSIVQKINEMRTKLPGRWRHKPETPSPHKPLKITKPRSFKLRTKFRSRVTVEDISQIPIPQFKARPLNRKIFESAGELGLSKIIKKEVTQPEEFTLLTEDRIKKRKLDQSKVVEITQNEPRPFKARKLDMNVLSGSYMVQTKTARLPTVPESPNLRTKSRSQTNNHRSILPATPMSPHITFRARPMPPTTAHPFVPTIHEHIATVPEPFKLRTNDRGATHQKQLENRLIEEKEKENEMRVFKARPITHYSNHSVLKISKPQITVPISPNLSTKKRVRTLEESVTRPSIDSSVSIKSKQDSTLHFTQFVPFHLRTEERGQSYQERFKTKALEISTHRASISKIDDGTYTSITKKVNPALLKLR